MKKSTVNVKLENEAGENICDLDLDAEQVASLITYAIADMQTKGIAIPCSMPMKESEIVRLLQYSLRTMIREEIKMEENKK